MEHASKLVCISCVLCHYCHWLLPRVSSCPCQHQHDASLALLAALTLPRGCSAAQLCWPCGRQMEVSSVCSPAVMDHGSPSQLGCKFSFSPRSASAPAAGGADRGAASSTSAASPSRGSFAPMLRKSVSFLLRDASMSRVWAAAWQPVAVCVVAAAAAAAAARPSALIRMRLRALVPIMHQSGWQRTASEGGPRSRRPCVLTRVRQPGVSYNHARRYGRER
jgi:hypothetical protein